MAKFKKNCDLFHVIGVLLTKEIILAQTAEPLNYFRKIKVCYRKSQRMHGEIDRQLLA